MISLKIQMVAGDKRRKVEDTKPLTWETIAPRLWNISEPRDSRLIALLYLSGRRVTEILHLTKSDLRIDENRVSFETFNEKVYRRKPSGNYQIERDGKYYERIRPHWRTDTDSGKVLTPFVLDNLGSLADKGYLFYKLRGVGHIHYQMAYRIVRFYFPEVWPHLLRHERFTEAARIYKSDPVAMHRFTFHKRFESTLGYIRELEEEKI